MVFPSLLSSRALDADRHVHPVVFVGAVTTHTWSLDGSSLGAWRSTPLSSSELGDTVMKGWLSVVERHMRAKETWVVLENFRLSWFKSPADVHPRGTFAITDILSLENLREKQVTIQVRGFAHRLKLRTSSTQSASPSLTSWATQLETLVALERARSATGGSLLRKLAQHKLTGATNLACATLIGEQPELWTIDQGGVLCEWALEDPGLMTGSTLSSMRISPKRQVALSPVEITGSQLSSCTALQLSAEIVWLLVYDRLVVLDRGRLGQPLRVLSVAMVPPSSVLTRMHTADGPAIWLITRAGDLHIFDPTSPIEVIDAMPLANAISLGRPVDAAFQTLEFVWLFDRRRICKAATKQPQRLSQAVGLTGDLCQALPLPIHLPIAAIAVVVVDGSLFLLTDA